MHKSVIIILALVTIAIIFLSANNPILSPSVTSADWTFIGYMRALGIDGCVWETPFDEINNEPICPDFDRVHQLFCYKQSTNTFLSSINTIRDAITQECNAKIQEYQIELLLNQQEFEDECESHCAWSETFSADPGICIHNTNLDDLIEQLRAAKSSCSNPQCEIIEVTHAVPAGSSGGYVLVDTRYAICHLDITLKQNCACSPVYLPNPTIDDWEEEDNIVDSPK